jgi:hypothetical protein
MKTADGHVLLGSNVLIISRDFSFSFIKITPAHYGLYHSTICGSISTPLTFNPVNIPVRKAQEYINSSYLLVLKTGII